MRPVLGVIMQDKNRKISPDSTTDSLFGNSCISTSKKRLKYSYERTPKKKKVDLKSYLLDESPEKRFKPVDLSSDEEDEENKSPVFIVTSGLNKPEMKLVQSHCKELGYNLQDMITENTTHLVTKINGEKRCKRTYKYILALLHKLSVVNFTWLDLCWELGHHFPEKYFEALGDSGWKKAVSAVTLAKRNNTPILNGCRVYCDLPFSNAYLSAHQIKTILAKTGATVVDDLSEFSNYSFDESFILVSPSQTEASGNQKKYENMFWQYNIPVASAEWLVDSVVNSKLVPIKKYLMTSNS